ncbi:MAG TPA: coenzyme F420-0:L-glutamate ligase [Nocardioidaceae bacterium]
MTGGRPAPVQVLPVTGIGEVTEGADLGALLTAAADPADGDILLVTSKVLSKAEGRVVAGDKSTALAGETDRVVARRGPTTIVRTRHGLVMAGAGVDSSNTAAGTVLLLPVDPDASARSLREAVRAGTGRNVAVLVTDTAGRAWRTGQTDIAIGAAGLEVVLDYAGRADGYGNVLTVTAPAVADELAAAADLVKGKLGRCPAAIVRGLSDLVLPAGTHGPGARALARDEEDDLFGYGAREAVLRAGLGRAADLRGFGRPVDVGDLLPLLQEAAGPGAVLASDTSTSAEAALVALTAGDDRSLGRAEARVAAVAFAHGWLRVAAEESGHAHGTVLRFRRNTP